MQRMTARMSPGDRGPAVVNLQDGLRRLMDSGGIGPPGDPRQLLQQLAGETRDQVYGDATSQIVQLYQRQHQLETSGAVDGPTTDALNAALTALGGLDAASDGVGSADVVATLRQQTQVLGRINAGTGQLPLIAEGIRGLADNDTLLALGSRGDDVADLHQDLIHAGYTAPREEVDGHLYGAGTRDALLALQKQNALVPDGMLDARTRAALRVAVDVASNGTRIEGQVLLDNGMPAVGLPMRAISRAFGGVENEIGTSSTDAHGFYALSFEPETPIYNLEIQAIDFAGRHVPLSVPKGDVGRSDEVLNFVAPATVVAIPAEYDQLTADLTPHVADITSLAGAQEQDGRQDLTTLSQATSWDARVLAIAALAAQLHADINDLSHEGLYALLRAGLPSDQQMLAKVEPDVVRTALRATRDAGVVGMTDDAIDQFTSAFDRFGKATLLASRAPGSASTYGDLLKTSGLDADAQASFASVYLRSAGTGAQLWEDARAAGIGEEEIASLQLHGKFAFLSGNSAPMTKRLSRTDVDDPAKLVDLDFYEPGPWKSEAQQAAGGDEDNLADLIPAAYSGDTVAKRLDAYAGDVARKIRLSYPTHVVSRLVERDDTDAFRLGDGRTATASLLKSAAEQGYRLGQTPTGAFFDSHPGATGGLDEAEFATALSGVKKLHRIYQITPDNDCMPIMARLAMDSADAVVAVDKPTWLNLYAGEFATVAQAEQVYSKATQVSAQTYSLFGSAMTSGVTPAMTATSTAPEVRESARNALTKQFPTMETLFGSVDYCECEHCRSVLGPAAYLVDLLQFLDIEDSIWKGFLDRWNSDHVEKYDARNLRPYDALLSRRPDLANLELTCANTTTELPYIDVVNEILEYFVANDRLEAGAAHDADGASSEDVLAEPENVIGTAYDKLLQARFPLSLPFDLWLETVRQFCASFDTSLAEVLEVFRPGDELFAPTATHDRAAVFVESLGLSPTQAAVVTDPAPLDNDHWYDLYGMSTARVAVSGAKNVAPATVDVDDDDAASFRPGDVCAYISGGGSRFAATNVIAEVGVKGSGGGAKTTRITFTDVWDTAPAAGDLLVHDAPAALRSAKFLARRLEVTYNELAELVQTGFVNSDLPELGVLRALGVDVQDAYFYHEHATFYADNMDLIDADRTTLKPADKARYDALGDKQPATRRTGWQDLLDMVGFETRVTAAAARFGEPAADLLGEVQAIPFDRLLVLADPDTGCDFSRTTLRHADGTAVEPITFLKINLFVRLWRALGWTMDEVDTALRTFVPANVPFDDANLRDRPLRTALMSLAHLKALDERFGSGPGTRMRLLTFWGDIPSAGADSLYRQFFLRPATLRLDDVFDHPLGRYLEPQWVTDQAKARVHRVELRGVAPDEKLDPALFTAQPKLELSYDELERVQHLSYRGVMGDMARQTLQAVLPASAVLTKLLDAVQAKAADFSRVTGHLPALQGALGLTRNEIGQILTASRPALESAPLSMANVSLLYRYAVLARALRLPVADVIALQEVSAIDPFAALKPEPLATLEDDQPYAQTLRFVQIADEIAASGLDLAALQYLLRHRIVDPVGKYREHPQEVLVALTALAEGIRAIRAEHAIPENPASLTDEVLRQKLGFVLASDVADRFMTLWGGTVQFAISRTGIAGNARLEPATFVAEPAIVAVSYEKATQTQRLVMRGVLTTEPKIRLIAAFADRLSTEQKATFKALLDDLQRTAEEETGAFFEKHLQKQDLLDDTTTGFLDPADRALLLDRELPAEPNAASQRLDEQRSKLAASFLPFLQQRLIRRLVVGTLTAVHAEAEPALVTSLVTDSRLLGFPQHGKRMSVQEVIVAGAERGVTGTFFASADLSGAALGSATLPDADLASVDAANKALLPAGTNSARLEGYLQVPDAGAYRFFVAGAAKNATATLRFADLPVSTLTGTVAKAGDEIGATAAQFAMLKPGIPYRFTLELTELDGGTSRLLVQSETLPKERLTQLTIYPFETLNAAARAELLLTKALQLLETLSLTERESRHILTHAADFGGVDLGRLPTRVSDDTAAGAAALFGQVLRLAAYSRLRHDLAGDTDDLVDVFEAAAEGHADLVYSRLAALTRRDRTVVEATANALFVSPAFTDEASLQRLWQALQVVETFGVPVRVIRDWTGIVRAEAQPEERFAIARGLKEALRARFDAEAWRRAAQPVFDRLRARQRDALVCYIMQQRDFSSREQLYEFFLLDPGMEPVVRTTRIRLAISSVQLFVQRCLMNLEVQVPPAAILNAGHWDWMKRYRVWEANRRIFLFPENYLEPEFRDDKTAQFVEFESSLLQGDVSDELVEDGFLTYLTKLDALARLDVVATHVEDKGDLKRNVLHVFGRTLTLPHQYHYRRYAQGAWSPWEPVTVEIEGDHLAPVVWRGRLLLFWVTLVEKPETSSSTPVTLDFRTSTTIPGTPVTRVEASLHWSEYAGGAWSSPKSGRPDDQGGQKVIAMDKNHELSELLVYVLQERTADGHEGGIYICLGRPLWATFYLASRNSAPVPRLNLLQPPPDNPFSAKAVVRNRYTATGQLSVSYTEHVSTLPGQSRHGESPEILKDGGAYTLVPTDNAVHRLLDPLEGQSSGEDIGALDRPAFYTDNEHTFFLEPNLQERPVRDWQEWVAHSAQPDPGPTKSEWWETLPMRQLIPKRVRVPGLADPGPDFSSGRALYEIAPQTDWLTRTGTRVRYGDALIGESGRVTDGPVAAADLGTWNVVGPSGLNAALHQNLQFR